MTAQRSRSQPGDRAQLTGGGGGPWSPPPILRRDRQGPFYGDSREGLFSDRLFFGGRSGAGAAGDPAITGADAGRARGRVVGYEHGAVPTHGYSVAALCTDPSPISGAVG